MREVEYLRAASLSLQIELASEIWADGEPAGRTPAEFTMLSRALHVIVPV
jgi:diacylglycerol kinase family enzyme